MLRSPFSRAALAAVIALAAALTTPAHATQVHGPADVASLTAASDAVVRAKVVRVESHWGAEGPAGGVIFSTALLAPSEWWKGSPEDQILVRVPGGVQGEWSQDVQGAARFQPGEEVVVFLARKANAGDRSRARAKKIDSAARGSPAKAVSQEAARSQTSSVSGGLDVLPDAAVFEVQLWALGKFAVAQASAKGRPRALRDRTGLLCRGCGGDEHDDLPLADLRARVDAALRSSRPGGAP